MKVVKILIRGVVCLTMVSMISARVTGRIGNWTDEGPVPSEVPSRESPTGVRLLLERDALKINVRLRDLLLPEGSEVESQARGKQPSFIQKYGPMMSMIPFAMQLLSLPGAIAQIKVSLLRSLVVAKMAIIMLIMNAIRESKMKSETVVLHQPQHHEHYYDSYHQEEDDDKGWLGG